jgi:hypothetical protein
VSEFDYYFLKVVLIETQGLFGTSLLRELTGLNISEQGDNRAVRPLTVAPAGDFRARGGGGHDGRRARFRMRETITRLVQHSSRQLLGEGRILT